MLSRISFDTLVSMALYEECEVSEVEHMEQGKKTRRRALFVGGAVTLVFVCMLAINTHVTPLSSGSPRQALELSEVKLIGSLNTTAAELPDRRLACTTCGVPKATAETCCSRCNTNKSCPKGCKWAKSGGGGFIMNARCRKCLTKASRPSGCKRALMQLTDRAASAQAQTFDTRVPFSTNHRSADVSSSFEP